MPVPIVLVVECYYLGVRLLFAVPEGFSEAYSNRIVPGVYPTYTHPRFFTWKGGELEPFQLTLNLAVLAEGLIRTPDDLVTAVQQLYRLSIARAREQESLRTWNKYVLQVLPAVTFSIGAGSGQPWWSRTGFIKSIDSEYMGPYDVVSGKPLHAEVTLIVLPTFGALHSLDQDIDAPLPSGDDWTVDGMWQMGV